VTRITKHSSVEITNQTTVSRESETNAIRHDESGRQLPDWFDPKNVRLSIGMGYGGSSASKYLENVYQENVYQEIGRRRTNTHEIYTVRGNGPVHRVALAWEPINTLHRGQDHPPLLNMGISGAYEYTSTLNGHVLQVGWSFSTAPFSRLPIFLRGSLGYAHLWIKDMAGYRQEEIYDHYEPLSKYRPKITREDMRSDISLDGISVIFSIDYMFNENIGLGLYASQSLSLGDDSRIEADNGDVQVSASEDYNAFVFSGGVQAVVGF